MSSATDYALAFDRELLLDFVVEFSRFEYALKRAKYIVSGQIDAKPDWDTFATHMRGEFSNAHAIAHSVELLLSKPPRKQIVVQDGLGWQDISRAAGESTEGFVFRLVRVIRNNLFHGGKYPYPQGPVEDQARDRELLLAALDVLRHCRRSHATLNSFFQETA